MSENEELVISDERLRRMSRSNQVVSISGLPYFVAKNQVIAVGDVVLDRGDGLHGVIHMIIGDKAAVRDGCAVELAVPLSRLVKLERVNARLN